MVDDDVFLDPKVWQIILNLKHGEFAMAKGAWPFGRVIAIHTADFKQIGGFNETYTHVAEDHDFYFRALDSKLRFHPIPETLIHHKPHRERYRNIHFALHGIRNQVQLIMRYWPQHAKFFASEFLNRLKHGQARTLLLRFLFFYYLLARKMRKHEP